MIPSVDLWGGADDLEKFFRRPPSEVSNSDVYRWRAACEVIRES